MRRPFIFSALLAAALPLAAEPVTPDAALDAARVFFKSNSQTTKSSVEPQLSIVWNGMAESVTKSSVSEAPFYVIGREGGGFVIIAGDDNARPVLGFSFENSFPAGEMPDHVKRWMDGIRSYCGSRRAQEEQSDEAAEQWAALTQTKGSGFSGVSSEYKSVRTNLWDQRYPYFSKVPKLYGNRCAAGCLPVALAEILTFFAKQKEEYRVHGDGTTVGGYHVASGAAAPEAYTLDRVYDWESFMNAGTAYEVSLLDSLAMDDLSQLVLDCGALVQATYTVNATAATEYNVIKPFGEHMGYNKGARLDYEGLYPASEWSSMLKSEMDAGRPVLCCGHGSQGGHAYVADGYASYGGQTVIHYNFGWSGDYNGYYWSYYQDPQQFDFGTGLNALFDFYPKSDGSYINGRLFFIPGYKGVIAEDSSTYPGYKELSFDGLTTDSPGGYTGRFAYFIYDKNGDSKTSVATFQSSSYDYGTTIGVSQPTYKQISGIAFGDKLVLCYEKDGQQYNWTEAGYPIDGSTVGECALMPAAFICTEESYSRGDKFQLRLRNTDYAWNGSEYTTTWTLTDPSGNSTSYLTTDREAVLNSTGTWTIKATVTDTSTNNVKDTIVTRIEVR